MKHIVSFDVNDVLPLPAHMRQKTITAVCGKRVAYGAHVQSVVQSDCLDCIHGQALSVRGLEIIAAYYPEHYPAPIITPEKIAAAYKAL